MSVNTVPDETDNKTVTTGWIKQGLTICHAIAVAAMWLPDLTLNVNIDLNIILSQVTYL